MPTRRALPALLSALLATSACPGRGGPTTGGPAQPQSATIEEDLRRLAVPPLDGTTAALERLEKHADEGNLQAAWGRAHYLIDLFDDARFRRDDQSLALLVAAVGDPNLTASQRGAEATGKVLSFLSAEVNRVIRIDRLHGEAQAALTLLAFDARPPLRRAEVLQRVVEVKAIPAGSDLSANALLRLYGYCRRAFEDAARARWADRMMMVSHCLYPLYQSDPDPYFADDPTKRPPPPLWTDLAQGMEQLLDRVAARDPRLAPAAKHQIEDLARFLAENSEQFPVMPEPAALGAVPVPYAAPYDWTPMLELGQGVQLEPVEHYAEILALPVQGDGRSTVALALSRTASAPALAHAIAVAKQVDAARLELLVATNQQLAVPPGDYWHGRLQGDTAVRLGVIAVAVAPAEPAPAQAPGAAPGQPVWDPLRAALGLHLAIGPSSWRLLAASGELAVFDTAGQGADPTAELRRVLTQVRGAFPDEAGLVLVPDAAASYGAVVAAANAAALDSEGRVLFPMLAFAEQVPNPARGNALRTRVDRRWQAAVRVEPAALEGRIAVIRGCYQDLLEKRPNLAAALRLEVGAKGPVVVSGPRDKKLRACVLRGAGAVMADKGIASALVELSPR